MVFKYLKLYTVLLSVFWTLILFPLKSLAEESQEEEPEKPTTQPINKPEDCIKLKDRESQKGCLSHFQSEAKRMQDRTEKSNAQKAQQSSKEQMMLGSVAAAGGGIVAMQAFSMYTTGQSTNNADLIEQSKYWGLVAAGLFGTGAFLYVNSRDNTDVEKGFGDYTGINPTAKTDDPPGDYTPPPASGDPGSPETTPPYRPSDPTTPHNLLNNPEVTKANEFCKPHGCKISPKGHITMPNGEVLTGSEEQVKKALSSLPPAEVKAFKDRMAGLLKKGQAALAKELKKDAKKDSKKTASGGGSGGFKGYSASSGRKRRKLSSLLPDKPLLTASNLDNKKKSLFKDMAVQVGGSKVGIAQGNIFQMVHQRYQKKRKLKSFVK